MRVHFVIHESYESPGAFSQWVEHQGFQQTATRLYCGETLPQDLNFDLLVVLGGPQSPDTTQTECPHFDAEAEKNLIVRSIRADKAVIGVCLGAQLIGDALGAKFSHSPEKEIGYFPIELTEEGRKDPLLKHFKNTELVGHWHNDMPGLLPSSTVLAESQGCPRQIVKFMDLVYGFQCHLEFTKQSVSELVECAFEPQHVGHKKWVQDKETILNSDTKNMNELLFTFLDNLVAYMHEKTTNPKPYQCR